MNLLGPAGLVALVAVAVVVVIVLVTVLVMIARARRLDRLHVRVDAARAGLVASLDRRAAVVRAVTASVGPTVLSASDRRALGAAARDAEAAADGEAREAAENDLVARLAALDAGVLTPDLAAELADADARVAVARGVHNDAVRDTRALRGRRMVRVAHLAGTAPWPRYFEIADPAGPPETGTPPTGLPAVARDAARVVVLDAHDRVLLFEGIDPARPHEAFWFTPGGGVEPGEEPAGTACRELAEETGILARPGDLGAPLWVRDVVFGFDGTTYASCELFFLLRVPGGEIDTSGFTELEARTVRGHRWWTPAELAVTVDVVYPRQLGELLTDLSTAAPLGPPRPIR